MSARNSGRSFLAWAFGISVSILFISLWGRAVVVDTDTLGESVAPLARSDQVVDVLTEWLADELIELGIAPESVKPTMDYVLESTAVGSTLDQFAAEVVDAAASTDPGGSTVDMRAMALDVMPAVIDEMTSLGYPVNPEELEFVVSSLDPLVIREPGTEAMVGAASPTATRLGTATLLAIVGMTVFGAGYIAISDDRIAATRSLATRVAVGGISFGVLLWLGSWILDPDGGRAPIRETVSALAGSQWMVPFRIGVIAALVALTIYVGRRLLKQEAVSPTSGELPTPPPEQRSPLSGSRSASDH